MVRIPGFTLLIYISLVACAPVSLKSTETIYEQSLNDVHQGTIAIDSLEQQFTTLYASLDMEEMRLITPLHMASIEQNKEKAFSATESTRHHTREAYLLAAIKLIESAQIVSTHIKRYLAPSITQLKHLKTLNADVLLPSEYESAVERFQELAAYIENDKISTALAQQNQLRNTLTLIEKNSLESTHIGHLDRLMAQLNEAEADYYAPNSTSLAMQKIAKLKHLIEHRNRDHKAIEAARNAAQIQINKALLIAKESQRRVGLSSSEAELSALDSYLLAESLALNVGATLDHPQSIKHVHTLIHDKLKQLKTTPDKKSTTREPDTTTLDSATDESGEKFAPPEQGVITVLGGIEDSSFDPQERVTDEEQAFDAVEHAE